jgi:hypothetical protein
LVGNRLIGRLKTLLSEQADLYFEKKRKSRPLWKAPLNGMLFVLAVSASSSSLRLNLSSHVAFSQCVEERGKTTNEEKVK